MTAQNNPFGGARMVLSNGDPIEELRLGGSRERALSASTGELNANDRNDAKHIIDGLIAAYRRGDIVHERNLSFNALSSNQPSLEEIRKRSELLTAANNDPTGQAWALLGSDMAVQINDQAKREGFMRRLLVGNTLTNGQRAAVEMPLHEIYAVVATSPSNVGYQMVRSRILYPDEFEIITNVRVNPMDIIQVNSDLLGTAFNEGLDSFITKEDLLWKAAADTTVGYFNPLEYISGELTPEILAILRGRVSDWNLPATTALIANDFWTDIIANEAFSSQLDPVTKYDLVLNGSIRTYIGLTLVTDAFRAPTQKVMERGEIYVISSPEYCGAITDRGGIRSTPTDGANQGNSTRGWLMSEIMSLSLTNLKSVAKAVRL